MDVWPTSFYAVPAPTMMPKPVTPTSPMAMPTGTRSSISTKSTRNPVTATASVLIGSLDGLDERRADPLRRDHEPVGADGDQEHGRDVAGPGDGEEGPGRQVQVVGQHVVGARRRDLVEEH